LVINSFCQDFIIERNPEYSGQNIFVKKRLLSREYNQVDPFMQFIMKKLWLVLFILLNISSLQSLPEYSVETSQNCNYCHISSDGGGELTDNGKGFSESKHKSQFSMIQILISLVRFVHIFFAFLWFGTILYVHLILKPAYASGGLPPNEVKVGVVSMIVIGITGTIMTIYHFQDFSDLFESSFGILLLIKVSIYLVMVISAFFIVVFVGPKLHAKKAHITHADGDMTLEMLKNFNGQEGKPSYICYKGKIYDVTHSKRWSEGVHFKQHHAGTDLTDALARAPHSEEKLSKFPVVGELVVNDKEPVKESSKNIFYFVAYTNLFLVLIILFILTIWKKVH